MYSSQWGSFTNDGKAYVIEDPVTPRPWENYLYSKDGKFQAVVTQRGLGTTFYDCPQVNKVSDGRNFCVCTKDGRYWSINGGAANQTPENYRCIHEPGKTSFETSFNGLNCNLEISLAPEKHAEIDRVIISNNSSDDKTFSLIGWHLVKLNGLDNRLECQYSRFNSEVNALVCQRRHYRTPRYKYAAFFTCDKKADSFCGSLQAFLGHDSDISDAESLKQCSLPQINAHGTEPISALQHDITLKPSESIELYYAFGVAQDMDEAEQKAGEFGSVSANYASQFTASRKYFKHLFNSVDIETPDSILNIMLSTWSRIQLDRQTVSARATPWFNWRNHLQDSWAFNMFDNSYSRKWITETCKRAYEDGFLPRCSARVKELTFPDQSHPDIATWAALSAERYIAESGDWGFLDEVVCYADGKAKAGIADILINGLDWLLNHRGKNGMVLMLEGDWSDPLEEVGRKGIGESPWTSMALINAINAFSDVLMRIDRQQEAQRLLKGAAELTKAVNKSAWDGDFYIRAITDDGLKVCTKDDPDGNVSLLMQSWALISGVASAQQIESIIKTVDSNNKTDIGPIIYAPPFMKPRPWVGRETAKPPGTCVNGSCYTHVAMMWAMAEVLVKRPGEAVDIMKRILPLHQEDHTPISTAVPLWMPNYFHGPASMTPGQSSDVMTSASPPWLFLVVCEHLLGIRATLEGLHIAPCMPNDWNKAGFRRMWQGSEYDFTFNRVGPGNSISIEVDGNRIEGNILKPDSSHKQHKINITLG
ncbi:Cellobiose phosphorylase [Limihaloglobus sulfuriphilus]|uniref:Cellobiose phosphorylase n=1 Tax=Limihaloglobus sulfuriphilus TaxID=1851148 RepID=A0A1Q2MCY1_9BACT|nr:hypothetical protein [Limihaloglobus sulfuriphilus]AQQ70514.1 Cellobiose phosphorylase [Limihaloglobus sulfuriphilus]